MKSLGDSKLLPFKNDGGHPSCLGSSMLQKFFCTPRSVSRHNPVSGLYGQLRRPHDLNFALTCTVNGGTLYRQVCDFPNHVQSLEFTTGGLQSRCWNISRMMNGNRMRLSSISCHSKGSEYSFLLWGNFVIYLFINLQKCLNLFSLCHNGVLCVDWWGKNVI